MTHRLPFPSYPVHTFHWRLMRIRWDRMFGVKS